MKKSKKNIPVLLDFMFSEMGIFFIALTILQPVQHLSSIFPALQADAVLLLRHKSYYPRSDFL